MTDTSHTRIPAGWYPDPRGSKQRRWWDGSAWTHALEALPETAVAAPAYANLPGPRVARVPSPSAPTVARAIDAEPTEHFPTRRQLRDAATVLETQKQFGATESPEHYSMGPAVSATQKPNASFSVEQFRTVAESAPTEQLTENPSELGESPAVSTAGSGAASPTAVSTASVTESPVSAVPRTNTFSDASQGATPAAVTPFDPSEFVNPVIPVNPSAQAAKALAAAATAAKRDGFVPVMRTGGASTLHTDPEYQPFGMTPKITTGVMESPTSVNTGSVWALTVLPVLFLGAAFGIISFAAEFYTQFIQGGLAFVVVMASFALAIRDRQQLTLRSHQSTASPAWIFLSPLAYLIARATHTRRQAGRGWAPAIVFVLVSAAAAAALYFSPLPLTAFFAPAP